MEILSNVKYLRLKDEIFVLISIFSYLNFSYGQIFESIDSSPTTFDCININLQYCIF